MTISGVKGDSENSSSDLLCAKRHLSQCRYVRQDSRCIEESRDVGVRRGNADLLAADCGHTAHTEEAVTDGEARFNAALA